MSNPFWPWHTRHICAYCPPSPRISWNSLSQPLSGVSNFSWISSFKFSLNTTPCLNLCWDGHWKVGSYLGLKHFGEGGALWWIPMSIKVNNFFTRRYNVDNLMFRIYQIQQRNSMSTGTPTLSTNMWGHFIIGIQPWQRWDRPEWQMISECEWALICGGLWSMNS